MIPGFYKIVEERILDAQRKGEFDNLSGKGQPLDFEESGSVPEDLRIAYKILKNADYLPPEIELKKEIVNTEELLAGMEDTSEKYRVLKKLNFMKMKLNLMRNTSILFEETEIYAEKLVNRIAKK